MCLGEKKLKNDNLRSCLFRPQFTGYLALAKKNDASSPIKRRTAKIILQTRIFYAKIKIFIKKEVAVVARRVVY